MSESFGTPSSPRRPVATSGAIPPGETPPTGPRPGEARPGEARTFDPRVPRPTMHPRRVVGGVRLEYRPSPTAEPASPSAPSLPIGAGWSWVSQRWMRPAEERAPNEQIAEGLEYARAGQTRSIDFSPGLITARVQGRLPTAYRAEIRIPTFDHEQWARVVAAMGEQAKYSAAILGGEVPTDIEDLFAPLGLRLFPADDQEFALSCTCDLFRGRDILTREPRPGGSVRWCKHICCAMYLTAERLARFPLTVFALRGIDGSELLEQIRQARALSGLARTGGGTASVYVQHVPIDQRLSQPLEESLRQLGVSSFWTGTGEGRDGAGAGLDLAPTPPVVSHPLLRRLGASPFADSKFPMVGLLATCYELAGKAAIQGLGEAETGGAAPSES